MNAEITTAFQVLLRTGNDILLRLLLWWDSKIIKVMLLVHKPLSMQLLTAFITKVSDQAVKMIEKLYATNTMIENYQPTA